MTLLQIARRRNAGRKARPATIGERRRIGPRDPASLATNSVKRLNNDAAVKAEVWLSDFGTRNVVPVAVLSGVFKPHNLLNAQNRGLTLYWAHRLSDMTEWMDLIRRDAPQE
ncbi:MAG: XamI family restriction endonuclease [Anaerolineales bacterium]|nr:XamI family restriction endonuclease [Anaerolineales bacterium]